MAGKSIRWFKIANEIVWKDNLAVAEAGGRRITLAKAGNTILAFAYQCPHASGILADGFIDALGNIVCPLHRYKFCVRNGHNVSGEGYYLKHWRVSVLADGVYIDFATKHYFGVF